MSKKQYEKACKEWASLDRKYQQIFNANRINPTALARLEQRMNYLEFVIYEYEARATA